MSGMEVAGPTSALTETGVDARSVNVAGTTKIELETQTHAVGIIQPPPDVKAIVDKTAQFVARNGPEFEQRILGSEKNNAKFNFLLPNDPYNAFYKSRIAAFKEEAAGGDAASVAAKAEAAAKEAQEKSGVAVVAGTGAAAPKVLVAPKKEEYTVHVPLGITSLDLDVIKLTAQFVARNGKSFLTGLTSREHSNPQFNFLKPTHSMFTFFTSLADAYSKVLMPPTHVAEQLSKDEDKSALLERALQRLEWERSRDAAKAAADDEIEKEREAMALIDWHEFVVVETIDFDDDEDEDLPMPLTVTEIMSQLRDADLGGGVDGGDGDVGVSGAEDAGDGETMDMDEDEKAMIAEGVAAGAATAAAAPTVGLSAPEPSMKIVRNYKKPEVLAAEAKARGTGAGADATKFAVSPITGELVAVEDMAEHMRISLIDPKWKTQKEAMLAKLRDSTMANDEEVATNILMLARTRPDVFGTTDEEVSNAIKDSIDAKKKAVPKVPAAGALKAAGGGGGGGGALPAVPPPPPPPAFAVPPPPAIPAAAAAPPPPAPTGPSLKPAPAGLPPAPTIVPQVPVPMPAPAGALRPLGAPPPPVAPAPMAPVAPPAPPPIADAEEEPATKKRKIGEVELDAEEDFLAANPGGGVVNVKLPSVDGDEHLNGNVIALTVDALSMPLSEFKKLIKEAVGGLAANKQKISAPGLGFLTDKNSLAYYNVKAGSTLTLALKERGGRKK